MPKKPAIAFHPTLHRRPLTLEPGQAADWQALLDQWFLDYQPTTATDQQTILRTAQADWFLRCQETRCEEGDPAAERRLDRAERTFLKWQRVAEQMRRARLNERLRLETHHWRRTAWERAEAELKAAAEPAVKPIDAYHSRPRAFVQYAEPDIRNGVLVTVYNPPTEILLKMLNETDKLPNHPVERTLKVRAPFPPEYEWFQIGDGTKDRCVLWTTTVEQAREDLKRELAEGHGHILPSPFMLFKKNDLKSKT